MPTWTGDPRSAVLIVLGAVILFGAGRKLLHARRARLALARLDDPHVAPDQIRELASYGREGITDLFRLLSTAPDPPQRLAAGEALASLWADDQLIVEEEKAIVTRGLDVHWAARRRYPRDLQRPFLLGITWDLPFLRSDSRGIRPQQLEWSYRVAGSRRVSFEEWSDWKPGPLSLNFPVDPADFPGNAPQRLILHTRVRTQGLSSQWEHTLPQVPFTFEFDPNLRVDALLGTADDSRRQTFARAVQPIQYAPPEDLLIEPPSAADAAWGHLALGPDLAISNPPRLRINAPLPADIAHRVSLDVEGSSAWTDPEPLLLAADAAPASFTHAWSRLNGPTGNPTDIRPGPARVRIRLEPDPGAGWGHPAIRSIWPEPIVTDWVDVTILRR